MRVLVTGGCGFLGAAVVRIAAERGDQILNLDRRRKANPCPALSPVSGKPGYARIEADVSDRSLMRSIFREFKPEAVIHLSAAGDEKDDARIFDSEVAAAFAIMEASRAHMGTLQGDARKKFRIVHARRADERTIDPLSPRSAARATANQLIESWSRAQDLPLVSCVAGDVFGPWQPDQAFLSTFLASLLSGNRGVLTHGGETVRDWLPVRDFADGMISAALGAPPLSRIEYSAGAERRDIDFAEALCSLLDIRMPLPNGSSWTSMVDITGNPAEASPGPMLDDGEAEHMLNWRPRGFHLGLDRMLNWAIQRYAPPAAAVAAE
jgi:dTDP-glucose 4,6-dehydratase